MIIRKRLRSLLEIILIALFTLVLNSAYQDLSQSRPPLEVVSDLFPALFIIVLMWGLFGNGWFFWALRRIFAPHSNIEWYWLQQVGIEGRPWSISRIRYPIWQRGGETIWEYEGIAYDSDFNRRIKWESKDISFDEGKGLWIFQGHSSPIGDGANPGYANVLTVLKWGEYGKNRGQHTDEQIPGHLMDLDLEQNPKAAKLTMYRISKKDYKAAGLKKQHIILNPEYAERLIKHVAKRYGINK